MVNAVKCPEERNNWGRFDLFTSAATFQDSTNSDRSIYPYSFMVILHRIYLDVVYVGEGGEVKRTEICMLISQFGCS